MPAIDLTDSNNNSALQSTTSTSTSTNGPGKVKQTRRRQRLSCVECTRRRQKCDRQIPCGLCTSRGIPDLCKWEPLLARPAAQRPPEGAPAASQQSTIAALSSRIAVLEETILRQKLPLPSTDRAPSRQSSTSQNSEPGFPEYISRDADQFADPTCYLDNSPSERSDSAELSHLDFDVQLAAVKIAQLSLAPSAEYIGRGTVLCALHKFGHPDSYQFPLARSSTTTYLNPAQPGNNTLSILIQPLLSGLPPRHTVDLLVNTYFEERSWQYSIPENWFKSSLQRMWDVLETHCSGRACLATGGCVRCTHEINPHWLALLYAVLALAPRRVLGENARMFFWKSMEARRLVEECMLSSAAYAAAPTQGVVHGVSLSCIAAALLASYLADRGRISDAWKLTGSALRNAQAVGLHRDPGWLNWEKMDRTESEIRLLAWWFLIVSDRIYSMVLGRPTMASEGTFDVRLVPGTLHGDGSENPFVHYQQASIALMQLVDETVNKCLGILTPSYATVLDMDRKYRYWLSKLHPSMDWRISHHPPRDATLRERSIAYQRHVCAAYYLNALMNLHRPYQMRPPPFLPPPKGLHPTTSIVMNPSRERCIELAMELVTVLCDAQEEAAQWDTDPPIPYVLFNYAYSVFDGAVTLVGAMLQEPPHSKAKECLALIDRATRMLEACRDANKDVTEGEGHLASRGVTTLVALRQAGRWDERFGAHAPDRREEAPTSNTYPDDAARASETTQSESVNPFSDSSTIPIPGNSSFADLASLDSTFAPPPGPGSSFPFLNTPDPASLFPIPGPIQVQSLPAMPMLFGDEHEFGLDASMTAPILDYGANTNANHSSTSMQTMIMPFDMLQNSDSYDVDWVAVMGTGGWAGEHSSGSGQAA